MPTRGLLGFRQAFLTATRGTGIVHSLFHGYEPYAGAIRQRCNGSLVAWEAGIRTAYAMFNAQERGRLFIGPRHRGLRGDDRRSRARGTRTSRST